jgi:hypothetical protein
VPPDLSRNKAGEVTELRSQPTYAKLSGGGELKERSQFYRRVLGAAVGA